VAQKTRVALYHREDDIRKSCKFEEISLYVHDITLRVKATIATSCTRNSSGDEIANVNFLYDDIVHE